MNNRNVVTSDERGSSFEWDQAKALGNFIKHRVSFQTALRVFGDPNAVMEHNRVVDGEQRWHAIGMVEGALMLTVVHVIRLLENEEVIRIISARRAIRQERNRYETANSSISS